MAATDYGSGLLRTFRGTHAERGDLDFNQIGSPCLYSCTTHNLIYISHPVSDLLVGGVGPPLEWVTLAGVTNTELSINVGGSLADVPPTSPGTYDEEFNGTADTLPANWAWTSAPSGSDAWYLNSRWVGMLTVEGTGNTNYTLTRTSFSPGATFGLWSRLFIGPMTGADSTYIRIEVADSALNNIRGVDLSPQLARQARIRSLRTVSGGAEAVEGTALIINGVTDSYFGITRDGSNNFTFWYSSNGLGWDRLAGPAAHTFTIDRIRIKIQTASLRSFLGIDWIRYRTDNEFPRV
jgi:hypothetical protein